METPKRRQTLLKKIYPWAIAAALFVYLFIKIPPDQVLKALSHIDLLVFAFWSLLYFWVVLYLDCVALKVFLTRFSAPISFKETVEVRGASFLIAVLNYVVGQGALAYYLKKKRGASLSRSLGAVSFVTVMDLLLILSSGMIALSFSDTPQAAKIRANLSFFEQSWIMAPILFAAYAIWCVFWHFVDRGKLEKQKGKAWVRFVLSHDVFAIFREARFTDYLMLFVLRLPLLIIVISHINLAMFSLHAKLAWTDVFLYNPIILLVSSVPLTPAGLGTSQLLTTLFFTDSVQSAPAGLKVSELLFAASLIWYLTNQGLKALYGAYCLGKLEKKALSPDSQNIE